jgi:hypothetical protein
MEGRVSLPVSPMEKIMKTLATFCLVLMISGAAAPIVAMAQDEKTTWDDLQLTKSSRSQRVYLLPGANFSAYTKVMLDPTETAFRKNWVRDYNRSTGSLSQRISEEDANQALNKVKDSMGDIFADEFQKAGFQVVQQPGPDVLRVRTGVIDLVVNAPDVRSANRQYSASWEAGEATLVVEARDSQTGALLGRALDRRLAGDTQPYLRNAVTNKADFKILFRKWAKMSAEGLNRLKAGGPGPMAKN